MNNHPSCSGCTFNTPKTQGGEGRICNGFTQPKRCPEWVMNTAREKGITVLQLKQSRR
jgi:hypothetical protein